MLTTTPFLRPRDGCAPRPMMLSRFSGVSSATMATIFDVPISRPTIRFLLSFTMFASLSDFPRRLAGSRRVHRKTVAVAQVDVIDRRAGADERADGSRLERGKARQSLACRVSSKLDREPGAARSPQSPTTAGRKPQFGDGERARSEGCAELTETLGEFARTAVRAGELRQLAIKIGAE